ncbi:hypothetical protein Hanom_Chr00s000007g01614831 [Helianthus anomalus]
MSGQNGGRGRRVGICMTQVELTALINHRVAEALATYQAAHPGGQPA